jgi:nitrite reductase/ring-hydroxylating ferredoxin subunit
VPYCVVKTGEEVKAFVTICTHEDLAMFPPRVKKGRLVCPHHGVEFSGATGEVVKHHGKDADPLPEARLEINDGVVYLEARKRHRKLVPKRARKWVERQAKKLERKREKAE